MSRPEPGSWTLTAPAGAYSMLPAWTSAERWFDALLDALQTPEGEQTRKQARVAARTLLRVAYADRQAADWETGRDVATSHATVAAALEVSEKTVQRARQLLEALGLAVTVVGGRYLTAQERVQAHATHGGSQLRAASTRALVMPATPPVSGQAADPRVDRNVYLPSPGKVKKNLTNKRSPKRAHSRTQEAGAPRRPHLMKSFSRDRSDRPRPFAVQQLAARLVERQPWLVRDGRHIGHLCDAIQRHQLVERGWTPEQIHNRIDEYVQTANLSVLSPGDRKDPIGYLFWLVRRAIGELELAPSILVAQEREQLLEEAARRQAEAEDARDRARAGWDESAAIIAAMWQERPSTAHRSQRHLRGGSGPRKTR